VPKSATFFAETRLTKRGEAMRLLKYLVLVVIAFAIVAGGVAWRLARQPIHLEPFVRRLPADNAYNDYVKAAKLARAYDYSRDELDDPATAEAAARENSEALAAARQAFKKDCAVPWKPGVQAPFPEVASLRHLAQAFWIEGRAAEHRGDYASAADSYLDAMRLGAETSRDGLTIHGLVACAIGSIGLRPLEGIVPHLSSGDCKLALLRLREIERRASSNGQILNNERRNATYLISKQPWSPTPTHFPRFGAYSVGDWARALFTSKREFMAQFDSYVAEQARQASLPYYKRTALPEPKHIAVRMLAAVYARTFRAFDRTDAQREVVKGMLAIQAFRSKYGHLPKKLEDVVPEFLPKTLMDPHTGKPLAYKLAPDGYLLYSFGPDQDDDGGTPLKRDETSGDLVAGKLFEFAD